MLTLAESLSASFWRSRLIGHVKRHLFEPFFTTKDVGKGTGLGLATCYGIVSQAGGRIEVESAPDEGATFRIYVPASKAAPSAQAQAREAGYLPGGSETILLAEDEEAVRELAAFVLEEQGYNVLNARNGEDALRLARRHAGEIHLLLSDVVMPEMGGRELADCMRIDRPATRALFMSGYAAERVRASRRGRAASELPGEAVLTAGAPPQSAPGAG